MDYSLVTAFETVKRYDAEQKQWEEFAIPEEILAKTPLIKDGLRRVQQDWDNLVKDFVADINGEGYRGYPTFYDGWVACEIGAIVRSGRSWAAIPDLPVRLGKKPGMTRLLSNRSGGNRLK